MLKKTSELFEARVIRSYLDSHGIISYIPDETTLSNNWHIHIAIGFCRILVSEADYNEAISLLKKIEAKKKTKVKETSDNKIYIFFKSIISIIIIYIIGIPIIIKKRS